MFAQGNSVGLVFDHTEHNFDTISRGKSYVHDFTFTNHGESPVLITSAFSSCGCIVVEYPHNPVCKGEKGAVKVRYTTYTDGYFTKLVVVKTDKKSNGKTVLRINGFVKENIR